MILCYYIVHTLESLLPGLGTCMVQMNSEKPHTYLTSNVVASNLCTSRSRVFLEHTRNARSISKSPVFYKTRKLISCSGERAKGSRARLIQFQHPVRLKSVYMLFSNRLLDIRKDVLPFLFSDYNLHVSQTHVLRSTVVICTRNM